MATNPDSNIDLYGVSVNLQIDIGNGPQSFRSAAGSSADYIESINVKIGLMQNIRMEIKLCPPVEEGIALLSSGICGMGFSKKKTNSAKQATTIGTDVNVAGNAFSFNKIMLQISYGGLTSPWYKGYLTMPELSMNEEGLEITLNAVGMLFDTTQKTTISQNKMLPLS